MKGLELAQAFYREVGAPALEQEFPHLVPRLAIGLAGEGSECFGFDDQLSRDHDWGAGFCIWMTREDFLRFGPQVQALYDALPRSDRFPPRTGDAGNNRVGCLSTENWYHRYTGTPEGPQNLEQWRAVPEAFLATAVNGAVFSDPLGEFSAIRNRLLAFYPEDIRLKKLAARAAVMAQAGQYNYPRCLRRGEAVAAQLALDEFIRAAISMTYLLNRRYCPFYKWMHRGLSELPILPEMHSWLAQLVGQDADNCRRIEEICQAVIFQLTVQGLTRQKSGFLLDHGPDIMSHIQDPQLRRTHIMEE